MNPTEQELTLLARAVGSSRVAGKLREEFGELSQLEKAGAPLIATRVGIAQEQADSLLAAMALGRHAAFDSWPRGEPFRDARDVANAYQATFASIEQEVFWALLLDGRHRRIREVEIARGALQECGFSNRDAFVEAIRSSAAAIIFLHNHPSGDPMPSSDDRGLTRRLIAAGKLIEIPVLDHIILAAEGYFSFAQEGLCF